ncbi:hypothetical protein BH10PLA2_BH10PLA2_05910 [soil metagenome]
MTYKSSREIAKEAMDAMQNGPKETAGQMFARLIRIGLIDTEGQITKLYGGDAEPEIERADEFLNLPNTDN